MLKPVEKKSVAEGVYEQLKTQIMDGTMEPGTTLPAERMLCEMLQVNRGAVREALKRLEQARLVSIRHGGGTQVLDYRDHAGLDLLVELMLQRDGSIDTTVVRSVMEMRSAIGPDAARLAARRGGRNTAEELLRIEERMEVAEGDLDALQVLGTEFWMCVVCGSKNVAYRLAYNSLGQTYNRYRHLLVQVLARELLDLERHRALRHAIAARDEARARDLAAEILAQGQEEIEKVLDALDTMHPDGSSAP